MTRPVTLSEPHFSQHTLNKYASLMAQGNGYLGLRASHEEDYTRQTRGMYLAGLYHRAGKGEINELVNLPDILGMEIAINGEVFSLSREAWQRELDFASGELRRSVVWRTSNGTYSAAIFLIPICISFDTAEKRRYATYLILNRRFSFEF